MSLSHLKIKESLGNIETHEVFLDKLAKSRDEELGISEKRFEIKIKANLIYSIFFLFFIFIVIIFSKTFYLGFLQGKEMSILAESNKGKISLIRPERGVIYDKNFKKLVLNSPAYNFVCDKRSFYQFESQSIKEVESIAQVFRKNYSEIETQIKESEDLSVLISENLDQEKLLVLESRISDFPDCFIEKNTIRNYLFGFAMSHVMGYNGRINRSELLEHSSNNGGEQNYSLNDYIGKSGLEKFYEEELRGLSGKVETIKSASGIKRGDQVLSSPKDGYSLVLNIDIDLQKKVYDSLGKNIKNVGSKKGAAVAINPKNGAILALVSYPSYDDNFFSKGISKEDFDKLQNDSAKPLFDRSIAARYPVGSTIKPFLATGALEEKIISPQKLINDPGYITIVNQYDPNIVYTFSGVKPHGLVDMRKAIAVSSNIYFFTIGGGYKDQNGLGPSGIKKYLDLFGWENKTGIDLPGEFQGFVPSPSWKKETKNEGWWDGDTYNLSIGQSDLQITPLQVAVAYSAIANDGIIYKPQIVQKIIDGSAEEYNIVKEFTPEIIRQDFIDPVNLEIVKEGMRDGVRKEYGSSFMLNNLPVPVASKTGTAETNKAGFYNTWISSFGPYDNPEIVFVATIEGVEGLQSATLPVAYEVLDYYFKKNRN